MSYKCRNGHAIKDLSAVMMRCPQCGDKIFIKVRQPVRKEVKAK
ncbi:MAG: hypothetical protein WC602_00585 [archaeon]